MKKGLSDFNDTNLDSPLKNYSLAFYSLKLAQKPKMSVYEGTKEIEQVRSRKIFLQPKIEPQSRLKDQERRNTSVPSFPLFRSIPSFITKFPKFSPKKSTSKGNSKNNRYTSRKGFLKLYLSQKAREEKEQKEKMYKAKFREMMNKDLIQGLEELKWIFKQV